MRVVSLFLFVLFFNCMTSPTDQTAVADRHVAIPFNGYAQGAGSMVSVQAYNPTTAQWNVLKTVPSSTTVTPWRGYNLYSWDAGSLFIPPANWQLSAGVYSAQVKAVSSDTFEVSSLKPDWQTCSANTTTAQEFQQQCRAATTPIAKITSASVNLTIYVDANVAVTGNGTQVSPYKTIGEAITLANTFSGGRKRIEVASGYYTEHVTLSPGIDLVSSRVGAAIINGGGSRTAGPVAVTGANDSSISGFVVTGGYPTGISLSFVSTHVLRNIVRGNYGSGISCIAGCTALIENNTVIGQLRNNGGQSVGINISSASPVVRNNIVYRQDTGFLLSSAGGTEAYNLSYDNDFNYTGGTPGVGSLIVDPGFVRLISDDFRLSAGSPARHAGDPTTFNTDLTRADMGAFDGNGGYVLSLAAQEFALEGIFTALWDVNSQLYSNGARTTPADPNPTFWIDPAIAGHPKIGLLEAEITAAVQGLTANAATPVFVTGIPANPCLAFRVTLGAAPMGTAYLNSWSVSGSDCVSGPNNFAGGKITGGKIEFHLGYLNGLPYGQLDANYHTIVHEAGHAYGGLGHVFRTFSPIAYGARSDGYGAVEQEAFALRASDIANYASVIPMADWFAKGYITQAVVRPFPAVEKFEIGGAPPIFHVGTQVRVYGSRFTMRVQADGQVAQLPSDFAQPTAWFNGLSAPTTPVPSSVGGSTRNIYVTPPAGATNGWLSFRARGLESIPVRILVGP